MHQKILESVQTIMFGYCADFRDVSMLVCFFVYFSEFQEKVG